MFLTAPSKQLHTEAAQCKGPASPARALAARTSALSPGTIHTTHYPWPSSHNFHSTREGLEHTSTAFHACFPGTGRAGRGMYLSHTPATNLQRPPTLRPRPHPTVPLPSPPSSPFPPPPLPHPSFPPLPPSSSSRSTQVNKQPVSHVLGPVLASHRFTLPLTQLARAVSYAGSGTRLRHVVGRLLAGREVKVGVVGGSISWGHGSGNRGETDWCV